MTALGPSSYRNGKFLVLIALCATYRRGFIHYTMGQLKAVAETFYKLKLEIEVMDQEVKFDTVHVSFKLTFDNKVTDRSNSG